MNTTFTAFRRALAAALVAVGLSTGADAQPAYPSYVPPYVKNNLVQVDVYDRVDGTALPVFNKDGRSYIVGVPGHEYAVRIRNTTGGRVLAVTSVDGVNVISGDTASTGQSGYVLEPWGSVEIGGWRKSMARTAAFYFTDLGDSYAARTGRPQNVGVIGVAVFQERQRRIAYPQYDYRGRLAQKEAGASEPSSSDRAESSVGAVPPPPASSPAPSAGARGGQPMEESARRDYADELKSMGKLGTGHGRSEDSRATLTTFERATSSPAETVAIQYDRRENLLAMGVIPQPAPYFARREPNPFPAGMRFAPDPR